MSGLQIAVGGLAALPWVLLIIFAGASAAFAFAMAAWVYSRGATGGPTLLLGLIVGPLLGSLIGAIAFGPEYGYETGAVDVVSRFALACAMSLAASAAGAYYEMPKPPKPGP